MEFAKGIGNLVSLAFLRLRWAMLTTNQPPLSATYVNDFDDSFHREDYIAYNYELIEGLTDSHKSHSHKSSKQQCISERSADSFDVIDGLSDAHSGSHSNTNVSTKKKVCFDLTQNKVHSSDDLLDGLI